MNPAPRTALALALMAAVFATGCASYVPFTQELRDQHDLKAADLQNLQFYNSHAITLRREAERGGRQVTGSHKLLVIAGKQIEEVVIEEHTPGVVVGVSGTSLKVSFEEGTSFEFALRGEAFSDPVVSLGRFAQPPDPFPGNRVADSGPEPLSFAGSGNFWLLPNGGSSVVFQNQTWEAVGTSSLAHLVISTESLEEVEEELTVLKGRQL